MSWLASVLPSMKRITWTRRRTFIASAAGLALMVGGAGAAWAAVPDSGSYRTATAQTGSITEELGLTGSIASASRHDASFSIAGTVTTVSVTLGDRVNAGDVLATLDTGELQDAVDSAEERVSSAKEALASDLEAQSSATEQAASSGGSAASDSGDNSVDSDIDSAVHEIQLAQEQLLTLVDAATTSLAAAQSSQTDAADLCQPFLDAELEGDDDTVPDAGSEPDAGTEPAEESDNDSAPLTLDAVQALLVTCQEAIAGVADAQSVTQAAQEAVAAAMSELDVAITALQDAVATSMPSTPTASGPTGGTTSVPSAADIVSDYADIDVAEAKVLIATQQLTAAVLTSPITGTVAKVAFAVGDTVAANSTTAVITILGDDGYLITTTVTLSEVQKVAVGQAAEVMISSSGESYPASVSAIGFLNVATNSATPEYSITIAIDSGDVVLLNGAAAQVAVSVATADDVVVIPISALHRSDNGDTVAVLVDGQLSTALVEVGAMGVDRVEITAGIAVGDVVVIADLSAATEETSTETTGLIDLGGATTDSGPGVRGGRPAGGPPTRGAGG